MKKLYEVKLSAEEKQTLKKKLSSGRTSARILKRVAVLLKADEGMNDERIAKEVMVGSATVERVRKRFCQDGLTSLLTDPSPQRVYRRKFDGEKEAQVIALACGDPPEGVGRWSLQLLADSVVELEIVEGVSPETLRQLLKETNSSLNSSNSGV